MSRRQPFNPFYVLLVLTGIVFSISACAYGVMAWRAIRVGPSAADQAATGLLTFLDQHGGKLLAGELAVLAVATFGAIGTDGYWSRRLAEDANSTAAPSPDAALSESAK